jgi:hypothetical protein
MESIFFYVRLLHIILGCIALLSGFLAIVFRNKVNIHKPVGKIYFLSMTVIYFSAVFMSIYHRNIFLFFIANFTYFMCVTAYRSLSLKGILQGQKIPLLDKVIEGFFLLLHVSFVLIGAYALFQKNTDAAILCFVFGGIGLRLNYNNINRFRGKIKFKNYWLLDHIGNMLGSYIGAITAFLVNNNVWLKLPTVLSWLLPTIFLVPLIIYELRKHKKSI